LYVFANFADCAVVCLFCLCSGIVMLCEFSLLIFLSLFFVLLQDYCYFLLLREASTINSYRQANSLQLQNSGVWLSSHFRLADSFSIFVAACHYFRPIRQHFNLVMQFVRFIDRSFLFGCSSILFNFNNLVRCVVEVFDSLDWF
jgi:hypothetical protein